MQPNNRPVIAATHRYNSMSRNRIVRLTTNGYVDSSFAPGAGRRFHQRSALDPDDKVVIGGGFSLSMVCRKGIARLMRTGRGPRFQPGVGVRALSGPGRATARAGVIGGSFTTVNDEPRPYVARLNTDGSVDAGFVPVARMGLSMPWPSPPQQGAHRRRVRDVAGCIAAHRPLERDGSLDSTFDPGTVLTGLFMPSKSSRMADPGRRRVHTIRSAQPQRPDRLNADGSLDTSFDPGTGTDGPSVCFCPPKRRPHPDRRPLHFLQRNAAGEFGAALRDCELDTSFLDTAYNHFAGFPTSISRRKSRRARLSWPWPSEQQRHSERDRCRQFFTRGGGRTSFSVRNDLFMARVGEFR